MNTREAMKALLNGKRIVSSAGNILSLEVNGKLYYEGGTEGALGNFRWEIYEEPNPHTKGTFAWAREEAKRGKTVRRKCWSGSLGRNGDKDFEEYLFHIVSIYATDWQVV